MPYREALETVLSRCEPLRLRVADLEHALHLPPVEVAGAPASTEAALDRERVLLARLEELQRHHADALARARADEEDGLAAHVTRSVDLLTDPSSVTVSTKVRPSLPVATYVLLIALALAACGFVAAYAAFHHPSLTP